MHAIWGLGMLSLTKCVVVVDAHVNVHDYEEVLFYAGANVDPARDVTIGEGPLDHLDHAPQRQFVGGKLGIDATAKLPDEGARPWPEEIEMSPEIRDARRPAVERVRHRSWFPRQRSPDSIRLLGRCANCYDVDAQGGRGLNPAWMREGEDREWTRPSTTSRTSRHRPSARSASPSASSSSSSA